MTPSKFKRIVNNQLATCKSVLGKREELYGTDVDRLDNFKRVAIATRSTSQHVLMNLVGKHWDALNSAVVNDRPMDEHYVEWITDIINYMLLLRGLLEEELEEKQEE